MFRRIVLENWHSLVALAAFLLTAGVFTAILIRTLRMKRERIDHAANLPLNDDPPSGP